MGKKVMLTAFAVLMLAALAAALTAVCQVQILRGKRQSPLRAFTYIKLAGVVSLLLTFFTVMVLLVPVYGVKQALGGTAFHVHVVAPVLSLVSFVWLDRHEPVPVSKAWAGLVPMALYGAVYFTQVIVLKNWVAFYKFNSGGMWYLIVPVIVGVTFGLSALVCLLQSKAAHRGKK